MDVRPNPPELLDRRRFLALSGVTATAAVLGRRRPDSSPDAADSTVVVLDEIAALSVLSLGVRPHSVDSLFGYASVVDICESLGVTVNPGERSFEDVVADRPSAVIGVSIPTFVEAAADYERVATTVVIDFSATWQQQADQVAGALGLEARADTLERTIQESIDGLAAEIAAAGRSDTSVSALIGGTEGTAALSRTGLVGELLTELGLARPPAQDIETSATEPFINVSDERLLEHDADILLVLAGPTYPTDALTGSPLWPQLAAVRDETVHEVFAEVWFAASAFSVDWILRDLRAAILGDGDVATGDQAVERWRAFERG